MKDNATLEDVLSALINKRYKADYSTECKNIDVRIAKFQFIQIPWQLNKPFSEQSEETKQTLNKIL